MYLLGPITTYRVEVMCFDTGRSPRGWHLFQAWFNNTNNPGHEVVMYAGIA